MNASPAKAPPPGSAAHVQAWYRDPLKRPGQDRGELVNGFPPCAMTRNDDIRVERNQLVQSARDDRLEETTCEVQPSHEAMDLVDTRYCSSMAKDVDDPRVAAARQDHQPLAGNLDHYRLIVPDPGVRLPAVFASLLLDRKPLLEVRDTIDLARDENGFVEEK